MSMMTSQILTLFGLAKTQKSTSLETETLRFLKIKNIFTHEGLLSGKKLFVAGLTFKNKCMLVL